MRLALEAGFMTIIVSFMFHRSIRSNGLLRTLIKTPDSDSYSALATMKARLLLHPQELLIDYCLIYEIIKYSEMHRLGNLVYT